MPKSVLVVGLGNPGDEYYRTRHNVGFHAIDFLATKLSVTLTPQKTCSALLGKAYLNQDISYLLAKPLTYMNKSGEAVRALLKWYNISPIDCIIITDNVDLPVGKVKSKGKGSGGTHNGIRSIQAHLQSLVDAQKYTRTYIGVGSPRAGQSLSQYVLGKWHNTEDAIYQSAFETISDAIVNIAHKLAQEQYESIHDLLAPEIAGT